MIKKDELFSLWSVSSEIYINVPFKAYITQKTFVLQQYKAILDNYKKQQIKHGNNWNVCLVVWDTL